LALAKLLLKVEKTRLCTFALFLFSKEARGGYHGWGEVFRRCRLWPEQLRPVIVALN
jgi:hypothetical protein